MLFTWRAQFTPGVLTSFITTDDGILKKSKAIGGIVIADPVEFVKKELT